MKPRIRPLSNLYHRWGRRCGLSAYEVFEVLHANGIVEPVSTEQYREIVPNPPMKREAWDAYVAGILQREVFKRGLNG